VQLDRGQVVELLEYVDPKGEPLSQTTADRAAAISRSRSTTSTPSTPACWRTGSPCVRHDDPAWQGVRIFYAVDPDGATLEFVERPLRRRWRDLGKPKVADGLP
jgi:hypothetical protein